MAEIKMDVTEYELMKEKAKLLEESLENERKLKDDIDKLKEEKIKALEDAKMKVVKVEKTEVTEHLLYKGSYEGDLQVKVMVLKALGLPGDKNTIDYINIDYGMLINSLFTKTTSHSVPRIETTTHGLDEIKSEIREDLKSKMDSETISKLEELSNLSFKHNEVVKELTELNKKYKAVSDIKIELVGKNLELEKQVKKHEKADSYIYKIGDILSENPTMFNKGRLLRGVTNMVNYYNDEISE